jgi:hypothetical protein
MSRHVDVVEHNPVELLVYEYRHRRAPAAIMSSGKDGFQLMDFPQPRVSSVIPSDALNFLCLPIMQPVRPGLPSGVNSHIHSARELEETILLNMHNSRQHSAGWRLNGGRLRAAPRE